MGGPLEALGRLQKRPLSCHSTAGKLPAVQADLGEAPSSLGGCHARHGQRATAAQVQPSLCLEAVAGAGEATGPCFCHGSGAVAESCRFGHKKISEPERSFPWVHLLLYNKWTSYVLSACCIHFPGVFASFDC